MDLSWLSNIVPHAMSKAAKTLRQRSLDHDATISQSLEDELLAAFEQNELPPAMYIDGLKSRYAGIAFARMIPKLSLINDLKTATWLPRFHFEQHRTMLFQVFTEQLYLRYASESTTSSLGSLTSSALQQLTSSLLHSATPRLLHKHFLKLLNRPTATFDDLVNIVNRLKPAASEVYKVAPFNTASGSYSALCTKVLISGSAQTAAQHLIGNQQDKMREIVGSNSTDLLAALPLRIFSEVVSSALLSIRRSEPYWLQAGRLAPGLKMHIVNRMKSPDTNPALWRFISPDLVSLYKILIRSELVDDFFDRRTDPNRANFWKDYTAAMTDTPRTMGSRNQVFLMMFGQIGVIETKQAGMGAVYFYTAENINRVFMKQENQTREHSFYKTLAPCPALESLPHVGNWQDKFRRSLRITYGILPNGKM